MKRAPCSLIHRPNADWPNADSPNTEHTLSVSWLPHKGTIPISDVTGSWQMSSQQSYFYVSLVLHGGKEELNDEQKSVGILVTARDESEELNVEQTNGTIKYVHKR